MVVRTGYILNWQAVHILREPLPSGKVLDFKNRINKSGQSSHITSRY